MQGIGGEADMFDPSKCRAAKRDRGAGAQAADRTVEDDHGALAVRHQAELAERAKERAAQPDPAGNEEQDGRPSGCPAWMTAHRRRGKEKIMRRLFRAS
ncbi:hypothetical protein GLI01_08150 [Gluconacetobacter liquefaciens]|nr:hypothetical protein GLI01_08150 [Gluconacetobacter liquefaciens]